VSLPNQLAVDLYGCEHEADGVGGKGADEEFGTKKEEVTGEWRRLCNRSCVI